MGKVKKVEVKYWLPYQIIVSETVNRFYGNTAHHYHLVILN